MLVTQERAVVTRASVHYQDAHARGTYATMVSNVLRRSIIVGGQRVYGLGCKVERSAVTLGLAFGEMWRESTG